jgi:broad specificity phosphatase PhoE
MLRWRVSTRHVGGGVRRLFLIRHAPTEPLKRGGYIGWSDAPLGERGMSEARLTGERISKEERIDAIHASDLLRARGTAEEISRRLGLGVERRRDFRELGFGEWEGLAHEDLMERDRERYESWLGNPEDVSPPGGETLAELRGRAHRGLDAAMDEAEREFGVGVGLAIVAHGGSLRLITCRLLGMPPENHWRLGMDHSGITTFEWPGEAPWEDPSSLPVLRGFNDLSHLKSDAS